MLPKSLDSSKLVTNFKIKDIFLKKTCFDSSSVIFSPDLCKVQS